MYQCDICKKTVDIYKGYYQIKNAGRINPNVCPPCYKDFNLEQMWKELGDIPVNNNDEIDKDFYSFPKGTDKNTIWQWFDKNHSKGLVKGLMNTDEKHELHRSVIHAPKDCKKVDRKLGLV